MALMKWIASILVLMMLVGCRKREVVSTDTAQSSTSVTNTDTSTTITPGTTAVAPTATETVAPSQPVNVSTALGKPSATKKTKH
jgi:hypothetical protein